MTVKILSTQKATKNKREPGRGPAALQGGSKPKLAAKLFLFYLVIVKTNQDANRLDQNAQIQFA